MKKIIVLLTTLTATASFAATTPMNIVEKASHRMLTLVKNGKAPRQALCNLTGVQIEQGQFGAIANGYRITLFSQSATAEKSNTVEIFFDGTGKQTSEKINIENGLSSQPIFTTPDGGTLLDLATEEIVDHLAEDSNLPIVAGFAQSIAVMHDAVKGEEHFQIKLKDNRIYEVVLDSKGTLISKEFKK
jgi:Mrp family chromosome partitioning ATPase